MTSADIWAVIIGLGIASALIRYSFLGLLQGRSVPEGIQRALGLVPVAAFPAIFAPSLFFGAEGEAVAVSFPFAALIALLVGALSRSMVFSVVTGAVAIITFQAIGF